MKKEFPGFFKMVDEDKRQLMQDATVVLDANVLLGLYRVSEDTANELLKVIESLKGRLWIPRQVAEEYLRNRLVVLEDQLRSYDGFIEKITLQKELLELKSDRHPFVSPAKQKRLEKAIQVLVKDLQTKRDSYQKLLSEDGFLQRIATLYDSRIGDSFDEKERAKALEEAKRRIEKKIPPGYEDKKKDGEDKYGDYFLWKQILDYAKKDQKDIIFITEDTKEDWWLESRGRTIGPRPELINEFYSQTEKKILITRVASFLRDWEKENGKKIPKKSIDEIAASSELSNNQLTTAFGIDAGSLALLSANAFETSKPIRENMAKFLIAAGSIPKPSQEVINTLMEVEKSFSEIQNSPSMKAFLEADLFRRTYTASGINPLYTAYVKALEGNPGTTPTIVTDKKKEE